MLKRATNIRSGFRLLHTRVPLTRGRRNYQAVLASSGVVAGFLFWYSQSKPTVIFNDSVIAVQEAPSLKSLEAPLQDPDTLYSLAWGSNKSSTLLLDEAHSEAIRTPCVAKWLEGVALRDLAIHKDHAACIDAKGDVYQWGSGHFGSSESHNRPHLTLRNKNIIQVQLTQSRLFALSASGRIYCLEVDASKQKLQPGAPTPSSYPWWSTGWFWGEDENVDFVEIKVQHGRKDRFKAISAGENHLLALTSSGRAFAHPLNEHANAYGQLGFRKIQVPHPKDSLKELLHVQLIPKSLGSKAESSSDENEVDWKTDDTIRFCPFVFEIPSLKDISVAQIAADGRVLGWGANEYGQIGLGANATLETITVPSEVNLWRMVSPRLSSRCIDVSAGGDLTSFMVEYSEGNALPTVDILMCGNGQWGGLGNNIFSSAQGAPMRARGLGALTEYDESRKTMVPILPRAISLSSTGHVLMTLDTSAGKNQGRDLYVWGKNHDSELGNGKKSSLPVPTTLSAGEERIMLYEKRGVKVMDLQGRVWGRVDVEQKALAGFNSSMVYWKIQN
ncbi:regulator of chromosome condensation 1/beta-lactamase-inhibitor protein II [Mucidula mucida]|nr:regulator of chromosome condensation 1/beta-lactamase-inhibitor protein II [Mucidula mucida]